MNRDDLQLLQDRLRPQPEPTATSSVAAADDVDERGYIWWPNQLTRHQLTNLDLTETRKRSQWLCINTAARALRRLSRYVGTSVIKPNTTDAAFNTAVQVWWREEFQDRPGNYDLSGKFTSDGYLTNCLYQMWRDGDTLSLHMNGDDGAPVCAAVEAARISTPFSLTFDRKWQDGILTDFFYRHQAYGIQTDPPGQNHLINETWVTVPAGHGHFFADFETQSSTRGTPALIHAVADLLDEREIQNALIGTIKAHAQVGYYFSKEMGTASGPSVPFVPPGAKRRETVEQGAANTTTSKGTNNQRKVAEVMSRNDIVDLPGGWKIGTLTDGRDHPNETEVKNGIYRKMAIGMGLPVELFILLDQLTGPGVRLVLRQTQDWREYWLKASQPWQSTDYVRRVEYAMRVKRLPQCKDPNFGRHYFVPPRAITIDDGRTANAIVSSLFAGTTTLDEIFGEKGMDWKEETTQSIEELQYILAECQRTGVPPKIYFDRQKALLAKTETEDGEGKTKPE